MEAMAIPIRLEAIAMRSEVNGPIIFNVIMGRLELQEISQLAAPSLTETSRKLVTSGCSEKKTIWPLSASQNVVVPG